MYLIISFSVRKKNMKQMKSTKCRTLGAVEYEVSELEQLHSVYARLKV